MKNIFKNTISIILVAVIISAGIAVPLFLLKQQEKDIIGETNFYIYQTGGDTVMLSSAAKPSYDEYIRMIVTKMQGSAILSEPAQDELKMEQAVDRARSEIQKLMNANVIPKCDVSEGSVLVDMRYENNELMQAAKTRCGFWYMSFAGDGYSVNLIMDALKGMIVQLQFSAQNDAKTVILESMNYDEITQGFLMYLGLENIKAEKVDGSAVNAVILDGEYLTVLTYSEANKLTITIEATTRGIKRAYGLFENGAYVGSDQ